MTHLVYNNLMALQTENGWYQIPASQTVRAVVPGTKAVRLEIQQGIPATIINAWAAWYHKNVEDIEYNYNNGARDDWAWSATNDVWNSNHLSGTAIDLNATKYPWGTYRMPQDKINKVREGLKLFEGTIFWGRDWSKPDEMHFQLNYRPGDSRNQSFADKLNKGHLGIYGPAQPAKPVLTAIQQKRQDTPWLAEAVTAQEELPTPDGVGRFRAYKGGMIYWTAKTGACAMTLDMVDKYRSVGYETSFLKYPTSDVFGVQGGRCQRFQGGSMYWNEKLNKTFLVYGRIGAEWASWNWEKGYLGLPIEDPVNFDGGAKQLFTNGKIYWSNKTDAHAIIGSILTEFERGGLAEWGFPLKPEGDTQDFRGRYQNFEFANIYCLHNSARSYGVKDDILKAYKLMGYEIGKLGYPISEQKETNGRVRQAFENGAIEVDVKTKDTEIVIDGRVMK